MCESPVIVGINDIANYLKRSKTIVRKMIKNNELPVSLKHGAYMTSVRLLDEWLEEQVEEANTH